MGWPEAKAASELRTYPWRPHPRGPGTTRQVRRIRAAFPRSASPAPFRPERPLSGMTVPCQSACRQTVRMSRPRMPRPPPRIPLRKATRPPSFLHPLRSRRRRPIPRPFHKCARRDGGLSLSFIRSRHRLRKCMPTVASAARGPAAGSTAESLGLRQWVRP